MIKSLSEINDRLSAFPKSTIAIAQAADADMLEVAWEAARQGLSDFILIGDEVKINELAHQYNYDISGMRIINCTDENECAREAISLVKSKEATIPMKGLLPTATFMRAVLNKDMGLRTSKLISQITITDNPYSTGLSFITDCAMNISPDLNAKIQIIENAVLVARTLGNPCPKVALITALETINQTMPETMDAAILSKMSDRKQIKNCIVDGPFALDNAISSQSAQHKGITGPVAGDAHILVMSDIRMGNVLHKSLTYFAHKNVASIIVGTVSPIIMTSRSDSVTDKVLSIAFSSYINLMSDKN